MISKKSVIYRFLCIWWVLINMPPRNIILAVPLTRRDALPVDTGRSTEHYQTAYIYILSKQARKQGK